MFEFPASLPYCGTYRGVEEFKALWKLLYSEYYDYFNYDAHDVIDAGVSTQTLPKDATSWKASRRGCFRNRISRPGRRGRAGSHSKSKRGIRCWYPAGWRRMMEGIPDTRTRSVDRIAAMNAFVRVVEAGSFAKAADSLDLPRPTLTRLIQALEDELRVRLLQRTTRALTVTAEGAIYYERVLRLLADLDDIESITKRSLVKPSGRIRVDAAASLSTLVIIPALPDFYNAYPEIEVDLRIGHRHADLIAESVDCAIRAGEVTDESLVAKRIGESRFITCASPEYLRRHAAPAVPGDLEKNHHTLGMIYGTAVKSLPFVFAKSGERIEVSPRHRLTVNDTNAYLAAGVAGLGIIRAPQYAVKSAIRNGELLSILDDWQSDAIPIHVVFPPNRFLSAKARVFIDWIATLVDWDVALEREGS